MVRRNVTVWLALLASAGCDLFSRDAGGGAEIPPASSVRSAPAAEGAMCKEHGVLEAVCTKCNPKPFPERLWAP